MSYATYEDYAALYGGDKLDEAGFARLIWEAERVMDEQTTGVDGVRKLRTYPPADDLGAEAVKRCACALTDTLRQTEETAENIRKAQTLVEDDAVAGAVRSRVLSSLTAGGESVSYAAAGAARSGTTAIDAAVSDPAALDALLADTARRYLSGAADANGVNLTYMGGYPYV